MSRSKTLAGSSPRPLLALRLGALPLLGCVPAGVSLPPTHVAADHSAAAVEHGTAHANATPETLPTKRPIIDAPPDLPPTAPSASGPPVSVQLTMQSQPGGWSDGSGDPVPRRVRRGGQDVWIGGPDRVRAQWIEHHGYGGPATACPLLMVFGDRPVSLEPAEDAAPAPVFALADDHACDRSDWPTTTPWLVLDRDRNGTIDGGAELFGSATPLEAGGTATDGFAALASLDANGDGRLDDNDPQFAALALWRDENGDRISQAAELRSLAAAGIGALPLTPASDPVCDDRGNCATEHAAVPTTKGHPQATLVDVRLVCR